MVLILKDERGTTTSMSRCTHAPLVQLRNWDALKVVYHQAAEEGLEAVRTFLEGPRDAVLLCKPPAVARILCLAFH